MPSSLILVPFLIVFFLNLPLKHTTYRSGFLLAGFLSILQIFLVIVHPITFWAITTDPLVPFFAFKLSVDNLTLVMLLTIGIVVFSAILVGWSTISDEKQKLNFINLVLIALIGMNTTVMVTGLFSLYVFIEITAVASFILMAMQKDVLALEGAFKYLIMSAVATVMMLTSIALLMLVAGDTSFTAVSSALKNIQGNPFAIFAVALFICGVFIKAGVAPFHGWLPDAYSSAPAPVSILLAGIVTKISGVYVLIRLIVSVFGTSPHIQQLLMFIGAFSIVFGALAAMGQNNFKRMLAYSSISQVGYMILALGCGTPLAIAGAVFHFFNHAIFKSLLFVNAAAVEQKTGTMDMDKMGGLSSKMPYTSFSSVIALLSTAGIPPLAGFWSKFIIIIALWKSGNFVYAVIGLLASVLTLAYFLIMQRNVFFGKIKSGMENIEEAGLGIVFPAIVLAVITIGVGLFFPYILNTFILPVQDILAK